MQLASWHTLADGELERQATAAAAAIAGRPLPLRAFRSFVYAGHPARAAVFEHAGAELALIPGGTYEVGFDAAAYEASAEVRRSYAASVRDFAYPRSLARYLTTVLEPRRTVTIAPMLVEIAPRRVGYVPVSTTTPAVARMLARRALRGEYEEPGRFRIEEHAGAYRAWIIRKVGREDLLRELEQDGFRLLTGAEWQVACGAGRTSLFRWGDDCPLDSTPVDEVVFNPAVVPDAKAFALHRAPNAFGLHIAQDPYRLELVDGGSSLRGGDGGSAVCGDYGAFVSWLPLATAYRDAELDRELLEAGGPHWYRRVLA